MEQPVRHSPQVQEFLAVCAKHGRRLDRVRKEFLEWCANGNACHKGTRSMQNCFRVNGYRSRKYFHLFAKFCNEVLGEEFPLDEFDISAHLRYFFTEFARNNSESRGLLDECLHEYEVIRLGYYDIEDNRVDLTFSDRYCLKISRIGNSSVCTFTYTKQTESEKSWAGYALAHKEWIFLTGVDVGGEHDIGGEDAVMFILRYDQRFRSKLLVGAQFVIMPDDPTHCIKLGGRRDLAVLRRIAAFRNHSKRELRALEAAAKNWLLEDPKGLVMPIQFTPNARTPEP